MVTLVASRLGSLSSPPWSKRVRKLAYREDSFAGVSLDLLCTDTSNQTDVVLVGRLRTTTLPKFAGRAMVIQDEWRRRAFCLHFTQRIWRSFHRTAACSQAYFAGPAFLPMPDEANVRIPALKLGENCTVCGEDELLFLAKVSTLVKKQRGIMKCPQCRRSLDLLEAIKVQPEDVIFENGIQNEQRSQLQAVGGDRLHLACPDPGIVG